MLRRLIVLCALVLGTLPATAYAAPGDALVVTPTDAVVDAGDPIDLDVDLGITPDDGSLRPLSTRWRILTEEGAAVRESVTGATATRTDPASQHRTAVDVGSLSEGRYVLEVWATWTDDASVDHAAGGTAFFVVDRSAPSVDLVASPTWLYPERDGYRDYTDLRSVSSEAGSARVVIRRDATGVAVRVVDLAEAQTAHGFRWWGTYASGTRVPSGLYTATVTYTDAGDSTGTASVRLNVRPEKLTWVTWTRTLTPKQAAKGRFIGACSALRGNVNGWSGGFGFWSNSRCNGGVGDRSYVEAAFSSRVPTQGVFSYGAYRVDTVGRANASRPTSRGGIGLYRASDGTFPKLNLMRSNYRSHPSSSLQGNTAVSPAGWVRWNVFAGEGHRWDARRFTVRLAIKVLRKPSSGFAAQTPPVTGDSTAAGATRAFITAP